MKNLSQFITVLLVLAGFCAVPGAARAQTCDTPFEVIVTLRPPTFGFPAVWDAAYGARDKVTEMASILPVDGGTVFTAGRIMNTADFKVEEIVLAEINRRGRALKEQKYPARDGERPVKLMRLGKEYLVLSAMRGGKNLGEQWARLSWYDLDGKYKREKIIKDRVFDLEAMTLSPAGKGGFIAVIHAVNRGDPQDENGVLMRFTAQGEQLWRRAYRPGIPNAIYNLVPVSDSAYIAAGRIRLDDGRVSAWAMKLGADGAVQWQRTYPRGSYSLFRNADLSVSETAEGQGYMISGDSRPYDGGPDAAWLLAIDALGEPQWQRYFRRPDYTMSGDWVRSFEDGRMVMMMNAAVPEGGAGQGHIRILTLSPRGAILGDEAYYTGLRARATDYADGWNGERIFSAVIEEDAAAQKKNEQRDIVVIGLAPDEDAAVPANVPEKPVRRGWALVATALDPYDDPCRSRDTP